MNFIGAISDAAGQPLTARVGTVIDNSPLQVDVQGTIFEGDNLGLLASYTPVIGHVVLLLGQAVKGAKTSGSSWVVMGRITPAP